MHRKPPFFRNRHHDAAKAETITLLDSHEIANLAETIIQAFEKAMPNFIKIEVNASHGTVPLYDLLSGLAEESDTYKVNIALALLSRSANLKLQNSLQLNYPEDPEAGIKLTLLLHDLGLDFQGISNGQANQLLIAIGEKMIFEAITEEA